MSVFIHVGQCGNQLGDAFWRLTDAPGLRSHGEEAASSKRNDVLARAQPARPSPLLLEQTLYHPHTAKARCILVDTEPKVLSAILRGSAGYAAHKISGQMQQVSSRNSTTSGGAWRPSHVHFEQSGRGNNWAMGYNLQVHQRNVVPSRRGAVPDHSDDGDEGVTTMAPIGKRLRRRPSHTVANASHGGERELVEVVMASLQTEIEALDQFQGTVLMHSLGGGTGAGLGCRVLETIRDTYPRAFLSTVSIAPSCTSGDTPLQNYNAVFTLSHLQQYADCVIYKENDELLRAAAYWKKLRLQATASSDTASPRDLGAANGGEDAAFTTRQSTTGRISLQELNALAAADIAGFLFPTVAHRRGASGLVAKAFDMGKMVHDCCPMASAKFVDIRTAIQRTRVLQIAQKRMAKRDPLFHAQPVGIDSGEQNAVFPTLCKQAWQSFPRCSVSAGMPALAAAAVLRGNALPDTCTGSARGKSGLSFADSFARSVPSLAWNDPLITASNISTSSMAPFGAYGGMASVSVCVNNGHVRRSASQFLMRGQQQFRANAYVHWFKQHGLEDADFETAFSNCESIVREYDALLPPT